MNREMLWGGVIAVIALGGFWFVWRDSRRRCWWCGCVIGRDPHAPGCRAEVRK
jgi:hypothetical protein